MQQCQDRISPKVRFRIWKTICSRAAGCSASQLSDPSVCTSFHGLRCCGLGSLELDACTLWSFILSQKVVDYSGSSLGLQEVRGCCDSSGLVAGGLPVTGCRAAHCEHTHSRRLAAAADREPCPAYQGFCCLVLVLPVCTSSVPRGLILKAAECCHVWCPAGKQFAMCWSLPLACWRLLCTCH